MRSKFHDLHQNYDEVFNPQIAKYNGAFGAFEAKVNMGPTQPPQRKGKVLQYSRDRLVELQQRFDDLEDQGVFKRPEDLGITAEYLNPSFLVNKPSGGFRLVTAFTEVGRYSKPQQSLMPDVDSTLRTIAQWRYVIQTDLTKASYQIWIMLPRGNNLLNVLHGLKNFFSVFVMLKSLSLTVRLSLYRAPGTNYGLSPMDPFLNVVSAPHFIFPVTISCT